MKIIHSTVVLLALAVAVASLRAETDTVRPIPAARARLSPHETVSAVIGGNRQTGSRVTITYGRPHTKDPKSGEMRKIWGGLVKWDKADRLGADEATLLLTEKPLEIAGTTVPAGAYTLYIVPSENGATKLAFSTALGKWGIPVDETHDVARFDLAKAPIETPVDQLTIAVAKDPATGGGEIKIQWETTQFSLPFTVKS
ncbi:MAG: DUF2911 domain-containing protein [Opitutaceae bacterium]|nr:DUF2911 domain-containing protein [Opitutaceae bacterium]